MSDKRKARSVFLKKAAPEPEPSESESYDSEEDPDSDGEDSDNSDETPTADTSASSRNSAFLAPGMDIKLDSEYFPTPRADIELEDGSDLDGDHHEKQDNLPNELGMNEVLDDAVTVEPVNEVTIPFSRIYSLSCIY